MCYVRCSGWLGAPILQKIVNALDELIWILGPVWRGRPPDADAGTCIDGYIASRHVPKSFVHQTLLHLNPDRRVGPEEVDE